MNDETDILPWRIGTSDWIRVASCAVRTLTGAGGLGWPEENKVGARGPDLDGEIGQGGAEPASFLHERGDSPVHRIEMIERETTADLCHRIEVIRQANYSEEGEDKPRRSGFFIIEAGK